MEFDRNSPVITELQICIVVQLATRSLTELRFSTGIIHVLSLLSVVLARCVLAKSLTGSFKSRPRAWHPNAMPWTIHCATMGMTRIAVRASRLITTQKPTPIQNLEFSYHFKQTSLCHEMSHELQTNGAIHGVMNHVKLQITTDSGLHQDCQMP